MQLDDIKKDMLLLICSIIVFALGLLSKYIKGKYETYKAKKESSVEHQAQRNIDIVRKLVEIRASFESCMRVSIWQFHNGEFYLNNYSLMKMSMTHEDVDSQFKTFKAESQGWAISHYPKFIGKLVQNDFVVLDLDAPDIDDRSILSVRGIKTAITFRLVKENKIVGFFNLDFFEHKKIEELNLKALMEFKEELNYLLTENV